MLTARHYCILSALALMSTVSATRAIAQTDETDRNEVTVAVGAGVKPSYPGSDDYNLTPGAVVRGKVENFVFFSRGSNLYVDAIRDNDASGLDLEFGPVVNYRADRHSRIEDRQVRALGKLDAALEAGAWVGVAKRGVITSDYDNLSFRVTYLHDVTGKHDSHLITPAIEYGTPLSKTTYVGASASTTYAGKGFGRYYYDVTPAGSLASGLPVYNRTSSKAGFTRMDFNLLGAKSLSGDLRKGWAVFAVGAFGKILSRAADSPIVRKVGSSNQWLGGLGIAYTF